MSTRDEEARQEGVEGWEDVEGLGWREGGRRGGGCCGHCWSHEEVSKRQQEPVRVATR